MFSVLQFDYVTRKLSDLEKFARRKIFLKPSKLVLWCPLLLRTRSKELTGCLSSSGDEKSVPEESFTPKQIDWNLCCTEGLLLSPEAIGRRDFTARTHA